ncbi:hypothetical protein IEQ34_007729 [Dendrobium chrysotoxum]|uniref:Uncharacterized protein n=1 Tax=Dendrobium chrysotoxum TaxID=161865 RepID=A0AAV7H4A8_DENCH|nr:hypothetical protein IEQ34_007729 [Dendrobium chrysotoxum]
MDMLSNTIYILEHNESIRSIFRGLNHCLQASKQKPGKTLNQKSNLSVVVSSDLILKENK